MTVFLVICVFLLIGTTLFFFRKSKVANTKVEELTGILDGLPIAISATGMDKKWIFVNKFCEKMIGKPRKELHGQLCENWRSPICRTENCGITCLENGRLKTSCTLDSAYGETIDLQVDVAYILNYSGQRIGRIEVITDVTSFNQSLAGKEAQENLIKEVSSGMDKFLEISNYVNNSASELSNSAVLQFSITQQFMSSISELSDSLEHNINRIIETNKISLKAKEKTNIGTEYMKNLISTMDEINKSSTNIAEVIKIIENISSQTNLLALNAAIESARAGEAGKGFAVVANEIRDLATKSSETVKDIENIIKASLDNVQKGLNIVKDTDIALKNIVDTIDDTVNISKTLLENSKQQKQAISQLNDGTSKLENITEATVSTADKNLDVNKDMQHQIQKLKDVINI
ncbi:hypothetical protein AN639_07000 [Candidatus Epulonipiscium fishelsonii]|uniref:Uncharacterized protein n=1 Tax=Candidatus Epulonipiscium fishelsonii TaxID=77094 RepID=A0ACC8XGX4_9FIRM|nr:hypothetical protein AN639_07000 [Epulopiscium sp. SCG-B05WGA-EpuloA1]ONI42756.1 hypothetical protein AN396_13225 [Epulopiscium sp. SCG-B11WGA-EpuloA1]